ncbi:MAG: ribokinase [Planctomycetaceae bacterium]|nr:MAG: ribokinase [Planctomycetaceae bacterium]
MPQAAILVLGSINTDLVVRGTRLPAPGETIMGGTFFRAAGGKGANQAVAAARAGAVSVSLIAAVGDDDLGRESLAGLHTEGIGCDLVKRIQGEPSGVALIMVDQTGQNCISVASGANLHLTPADIDAIDEPRFEQSAVLLACLEAPVHTVIRGLQRARQMGLTTILNPAPADLQIASPDVLKYVDIITPNETEAALLTGQAVQEPAQAIAAGKRLIQLGCRHAIVTMGARGCVVVDDQVRQVAALPVRAVDTTAAGDAFNGTLALALAEGKDLMSSVGWAVSAAAISVTRPGAQPSLPRRDEIDRAFRRLEI